MPHLRCRGEGSQNPGCLPYTRLMRVIEVWDQHPAGRQLALRKKQRHWQLLLSNHERKCFICVRSANCELQALCRELGGRRRFI